MELKLTFSGNAVVKKSNATKRETWLDKKHNQWRIYMKNGRITPIYYYTDAYKNWAKSAIQQCINYKTKHPEVQFPLTGKYNLKCLFYYDKDIKIDLSALLEGVQDVLAGNEKWISLDKNIWQIISDDSVRFIGSHDGTRWIYNPSGGFTEVTLTDYII